ncbi:hypothetical protein HAX54_019754, partial [Datura stramonium]|nr:hypothetical protein [Datura stramonium]
ATYIPDPVPASPPVFSSVTDLSPSTPACPSQPSTDSYLASLENIDWYFIQRKIDNEPTRDMEGGRRLTYGSAIGVGDYIPDMLCPFTTHTVRDMVGQDTSHSTTQDAQ